MPLMPSIIFDHDNGEVIIETAHHRKIMVINNAGVFIRVEDTSAHAPRVYGDDPSIESYIQPDEAVALAHGLYRAARDTVLSNPQDYPSMRHLFTDTP